jgi:hypothetical protein
MLKEKSHSGWTNFWGAGQLKVVVGQEAPKIVCLKPMVEMHLVKIRGDDFLAQLMGFTAQERDLQPGQHGNQGLRDSIRIT